MAIYQEWKNLVEMQQTQEAQVAFWREYFAQEQKNYEKILENSNTVFAGSFAGLADQFDMEKVVFAGFMDGINDSLKQGYEVEKLDGKTRDGKKRA